jgi:hypothetical protein
VDSKRESARMSSSFSGIWIVECGFYHRVYNAAYSNASW